jgi:hypothetical protein
MKNMNTARKYSFTILLIALFSSLNQLQAQKQEQVIPTDSIQEPLQFELINGESFNFWENRFKGNWAGVFFSVNGFAQADYSMYPDDVDGFMEPTLWKSNCLSINLIQTSIRLQRTRNFIGLVTGLGADFQSYRLDKSYSIEKGATKVEPVQLDYERNQKSKFSSVYLSVPLLIEFQVPVGHYDNRIYFSTGIIGSLRVDTHTKVKYRVDGKKKKTKEPDDYYLRDFRFAGTVRMGYRWINLFATYDLQPLFKDGRGPELYPFSVGIGLVTF